MFLSNRWLAVDKEDGLLECMVPSATKKDLASFSHLFYSKTRKDMSDSNLWVSLVSRPTRSRFTRVQRLASGLALLFATMIANAMWYRTDENLENVQLVHLGPFTFTPQQVWISLASSFVSLPVSILIVTLFKRSAGKRRKPGSGVAKAKYRKASGGELSTTAGSDVSGAHGYLGEELDEDLVNTDTKPAKRLSVPTVQARLGDSPEVKSLAFLPS